MWACPIAESTGSTCPISPEVLEILKPFWQGSIQTKQHGLLCFLRTVPIDEFVRSLVDVFVFLCVCNISWAVAGGEGRTRGASDSARSYIQVQDSVTP